MTSLNSPELTAVICALEHRAWSALCTSGPALLPLLSSSPVMIFPNNVLLTSTSSPSVRSMLQDDGFQPWKSYALSHDEVVPLGAEAALVYYRVEATRGEEAFKAVCSSAWVREQGEWKMASHQQTLL